MKQCVLCEAIGKISRAFTKQEIVAHFNKFHKKQIEDRPEINSGMSCEEIRRAIKNTR